jgi:DNA helicase-2/ATP-dependent DNA helicase PcrA
LGSVAELPPSLRGDRAIPGDDAGGVPVLDLEGATHRGDIADAVTEHKAALARRRLDEDRRLFYVALTRTERVLLVSAHHWAPGTSSPKGPSSFLAELHGLVETTSAIGGAEIGTVQHWEPTPPDGADNPYATVELTALWPADPLGARREDVIMGSAAVRAALVESASVEESSSENPDDDDPDGWARDVELLLAERDAVSRPETDVVVPDTMSVSQVVHLVADPDALASTLRRPVPFAPNPLARRGTAFHAWVERRFGATRLLDLDELPGAADGASAADTDLEELQRAFDASPWALRSPVEVEVPFETSVGGVVLRGRMDAVFADSDGGWTVVDWKTGAQPTPAEERAVAIQLAAYRLAWAELMSATRSEPVPLTTVRAAFHYVRSGVTVSPTDLPDAERLAEIISTAGADPAT